jgi:hypothetical protein
MKTANRVARLLLIVGVAAAITAAPPYAHVQATSGVTTAAAGQPKSLLITIVEGEGALNDIRTRTAREPIVEVDDENHKPVAGALVLFSLDKSGSAYANFSGVSSLSVHTDAAGRAVAKGFQVTQHKGNYQINVHASNGELVGDAVINETNVAVPVSGNAASTTIGVVSHKKVIWIVSGIVAAGAVAGIVVATQQSSPTTVSAGTGTVGAPAATGGFRFQLRARHP